MIALACCGRAEATQATITNCPAQQTGKQKGSWAKEGRLSADEISRRVGVRQGRLGLRQIVFQHGKESLRFCQLTLDFEPYWGKNAREEGGEYDG